MGAKSRKGELMRILARRTLREFWGKHAKSEQPLKAWYEKVEKAKWTKGQDVLDEFGIQVKLIKGNRARFKIKGNDYRIIIAIDYLRLGVFIKFVGTHAEYDKVDAETINIT